MTAAKQTSIVFLTKNRLDFFDFATSSISQLPFSPSATKYQELIDPLSFEAQITSFVKGENFPQSQITIVLADELVYQKPFTQPSQDQPANIDEQITNFIENIPFENVARKLIKSQTGSTIIAVNQDFYEIVKSALEKLGFSILAVFPAFVFTLGIQGLDSASCQTILSKLDSVREFNFLSDSNEKTQQITTPSEQKTSEPPHNEKSNKKLLVFIAIFILLIVILVFLVITQQQMK